MIKLGKKSGFSIIEIMVAVSIIAMLSAIAVPSFLKYVKMSRSTEAVGNMRRLYEGEIAYFVSDLVNRAGGKLDRQFVSCARNPSTVPPGRKVLASWDGLCWRQLNFSQDSPVFYSYQVITAGTGTAASFSVRAEGNLDNDAVFSLFEKIASINTTTGDVEGSAGVYVAREVE